MDTFRIVQALQLPTGTVQSVTSSLVHQGKVYAHDVALALSPKRTLHLDARQLPIEVTALAGQYGEVVAYLTDFTHLGREPHPDASTPGRYLGPQLSVLFFPDLLSRYLLLEAGQGDYNNVPAFQDDYARISAAYHPLGFPIEPFEAVPMMHTDFGVFCLGVRALEQLAAVVRVGELFFFNAQAFSLVSFKQLAAPHSRA